MLGLYDIRNNRGVGHAGADVDPNVMDATAVVHLSKWLVAELIRLLHGLPTDEATRIVENLMERESPWIWREGAKRRLLRTGLTWKEQTLALLLAEDGPVLEVDLITWLEHPSAANLRKNVLRPMHKSRLIEYDSDVRTVQLLPPGVAAAERLLSENAT